MSTSDKLASGWAAFGCALVVWVGAGVLAAQNTVQPSPSIPARPAVYATSIELIHDKPFVSVMVNGRGPYRFLIDTGTGTQAMVSLELARELALPVVGHARLTDPSGKGDQRSAIVLIDSLNLAGAEFTGIKAVGHRIYGQEEFCQGVLGFTLFKDYLFTLDFKGRHLILAKGSLNQNEGGSVLSFRMPEGVPIVPMRIGGQYLEGLIDSGGTGLSLPESVATGLKFESPPVEFGKAESLATRFHIKAARLRQDVRLGRYTYKQAFVEINSAFPLANIGSTPLKSFMLTFDQSKMLVRLYSDQKTLRLDASPTTMELINEPRHQAADSTLVPVGF